jgi:ribulose-phosphate 3-epimerase
MSVEPGFGGQSFMEGALEKVAQLRALSDKLGLQTIIEVDGGISSHNSGVLFAAGADVLVSGNAIFGAENPLSEIEKMLE